MNECEFDSAEFICTLHQDLDNPLDKMDFNQVVGVPQIPENSTNTAQTVTEKLNMNDFGLG